MNVEPRSYREQEKTGEHLETLCQHDRLAKGWRVDRFDHWGKQATALKKDLSMTPHRYMVTSYSIQRYE